MKNLIILLIVSLIFLHVLISASYIGDVTTYSENWQGGNCGYTSLFTKFQSLGTKYFAALNQPQWNKMQNCGLCAKVTCTSKECKNGKSVIVMITDRCPECQYGDLDLSFQAFKDLTEQTPSRLRITWDFIECPKEYIQGNIEYYIKEPNGYWLALQPRNTLRKIIKMEINRQGQWYIMSSNLESVNTIDNYYFLIKFADGIKEGEEYTIRTTAEDGSTIIDTFSTLNPPSNILYSKSQFGVSNTIISSIPITSDTIPENSINPFPTISTSNVTTTFSIRSMHNNDISGTKVSQNTTTNGTTINNTMILSEDHQVCSKIIVQKRSKQTKNDFTFSFNIIPIMDLTHWSYYLNFNNFANIISIKNGKVDINDTRPYLHIVSNADVQNHQQYNIEISGKKQNTNTTIINEIYVVFENNDTVYLCDLTSLMIETKFSNTEHISKSGLVAIIFGSIITVSLIVILLYVIFKRYNRDVHENNFITIQTPREEIIV